MTDTPHTPAQGIGRTFMEMTKYKYATPSAQQRGEPQPPLELPFDNTAPLIDLPDARAHNLELANVYDLITDRQTWRNYANHPLSLSALSFLLWATQGIKSFADTYATQRTVPSAGARHAFETYLLVHNVDDLEPGIYRYIASQHKLLRLDLGDQLTTRVTRACMNQEQVVRSAVTFIWAAVMARMFWRYGERGYRYLHLDAGHVCQNLYLAAEAQRCGVCAIAAFDDEALNDILGLDGEDTFAIYVATVGQRRT